MKSCLESNCNYPELLKDWKELEEAGLSVDPNGGNFLIDDAGHASFIDLKCTRDIDEISQKHQVSNMISCFLPMEDNLDDYFQDAPEILDDAKKTAVQLAEKIRMSLEEAGFEHEVIDEAFREDFAGIEKAEKEMSAESIVDEQRFSTTEIGKTTINTPTIMKQEVQKVEQQEMARSQELENKGEEYKW